MSRTYFIQRAPSKRQRTGAVQDLAEFAAPSVVAKRHGLLDRLDEREWFGGKDCGESGRSCLAERNFSHGAQIEFPGPEVRDRIDSEELV